MGFRRHSAKKVHWNCAWQRWQGWRILPVNGPKGAHHLGCQEPGEGAGGAGLSSASTALVVVGGETPGGGADLRGLLAVCEELVPARHMLLSIAEWIRDICKSCVEAETPRRQPGGCGLTSKRLGAGMPLCQCSSS